MNKDRDFDTNNAFYQKKDHAAIALASNRKNDHRIHIREKQSACGDSAGLNQKEQKGRSNLFYHTKESACGISFTIHKWTVGQVISDCAEYWSINYTGCSQSHKPACLLSLSFCRHYETLTTAVHELSQDETRKALLVHGARILCNQTWPTFNNSSSIFYSKRC